MKSVKSNFQVQQSSELDVAMRNTLQERSSFLDEGLPLSRYTDLHETSLYCQGAPPPTSEEGQPSVNGSFLIMIEKIMSFEFVGALLAQQVAAMNTLSLF